MRVMPAPSEHLDKSYSYGACPDWCLRRCLLRHSLHLHRRFGHLSESVEMDADVDMGYMMKVCDIDI